MSTTNAPRLTSLSHGGGCGCKIAPDVLADLLRDAAVPGVFPDLLVGNESSDDAAVYKLNEEQALVATTDFFMPIVDDPRDFGRIAATNALSDVYAMGGRPIMALALVGMPLDKLPAATIRAILAGGAEACGAAEVPIAGGHSIDSVEPIYGLAVLGLVHPDRIKRNDGARPGDVLILSKGLGVGVLSAALKKERLSEAGYWAMIESTTQLNAVGAALASRDDVHAITDVTGFGLLGHTLELCRGAGLAATIEYDALPWLPGVQDLATDGVYTGASGRNWNACERHASIDPRLPTIAQTLVTDPQTSGGLLIACSAESADDIMAMLRADGCSLAAQVGRLRAGTPHVTVA